MRFATLVLLLLPVVSAAQTPGTCAFGVATDTLRVNDVAAALQNNGLLFNNWTTSGRVQGYRIAGEEGTNAVFGASLLVGGRVGGDLRAAGSVSRFEGAEFWPGPLNDGGTLPNPADCSAYDRIWAVSASDLAAYEAGGAPTPDLATWPVGLGAPAVDAAGRPVAATSRERIVDLAAGERPVVYGSQTAFWVMNDVGNRHDVTKSAPLGIEVAVTAFAVASTDLAFDRSTFFRYAITNRNRQPIEDAYVSVYADPALLGGSDYSGADPTRSMGFAYHAVDGRSLGPSAFGVDLLGGSVDGRPGLSSFVVFGTGIQTDVPVRTAQEVYRVMQGGWPDGTPITAYGDGYRDGGERTTVFYPGDPVTGQFWSDENTGNGRGDVDYWDRRFFLTTGPGSLSPGETWTLDLGLLYTLGTDRLDAVAELRKVSDLVQSRYDDGSLFATTPVPERVAISSAPALVSPADGAGPLTEGIALDWEPVPNASEYDVQLSRSETFEVREADRLFTETKRLFKASSWQGAPSDIRPGTVYWRVRGRRGSVLGPFSEVRSFQYDGAASRLPDVLGIVEVAGPVGSDPCAETALSRDGCPPPGGTFSPFFPGNSVRFSLNGTGKYIVISTLSLRAFAPKDYEIRFVGLNEGAYAYYGRGTQPTGRATRVPFQIWDLGVVAPGQANDPSDDVQLIPVLRADAGTSAAAECTFGFNAPGVLNAYSNGPLGPIGAATQRIYAYYPKTNYAAWAAAAAPFAATCASGSGPLYGLIDFNRGSPITNDVLARMDDAFTIEDMTGVVIRYYTKDALPTADERPPLAAATALGLPYPNPSRGGVAVPFTVVEAGPVRVSVVDVLGREVAVLADGPSGVGEHVAQLPPGLAAGLYTVVLRSGAVRSVQRVTVVR